MTDKMWLKQALRTKRSGDGGFTQSRLEMEGSRERWAGLIWLGRLGSWGLGALVSWGGGLEMQMADGGACLSATLHLIP